MKTQYKQFLREIKDVEMEKWKLQKQKMALGVIEAFIESDMEMAEVDLAILPEPEPKEGSRLKSTKQDSFASSFYAWKRKKSTQEKLARLETDILLIRRGQKIALKKIKKKE